MLTVYYTPECPIITQFISRSATHSELSHVEVFGSNNLGCIMYLPLAFKLDHYSFFINYKSKTILKDIGTVAPKIREQRHAGNSIHHV